MERGKLTLAELREACRSLGIPLKEPIDQMVRVELIITATDIAAVTTEFGRDEFHANQTFCKQKLVDVPEAADHG